MSTTIPNVVVPKQQWTNLYTLAGITSGVQVVVFNRSSYPVFVMHSTSAPTGTNKGYPILVNENFIFASSAMGLWAYCDSDALICVQEATLQKYRQGAAYTTSAHALGMPFAHAVALNLVPGCRRQVALGVNPDIDTGTFPEDIIPQGGFYPWQTSAKTIKMISDSADDTSAGIGFRTALIIGLNSSRAEQQEVLSSNGATGTTSVNQYLRLNTVLVMSAGTNGTNIGTVDFVDNAAPTTILHRMLPGRGIGQSSHFTVPAGYTYMIDSLFFCINRPTAATDASFATYFGSQNGFYRLPLELSISGTPYRHDVSPPIPATEGTDITIRSTFVNQNNSNLTAAFSGILYQNSAILAL